MQIEIELESHFEQHRFSVNSLKPVLHFSGAAKVAAVTGAPQIGRAATCRVGP